MNVPSSVAYKLPFARIEKKKWHKTSASNPWEKRPKSNECAMNTPGELASCNLDGNEIGSNRPTHPTNKIEWYKLQLPQQLQHPGEPPTETSNIT